jgi:hypothetical protein
MVWLRLSLAALLEGQGGQVDVVLIAGASALDDVWVKLPPRMVAGDAEEVEASWLSYRGRDVLVAWRIGGVYGQLQLPLERGIIGMLL